jgi:hypothetical protein
LKNNLKHGLGLRVKFKVAHYQKPQDSGRHGLMMKLSL